MLQKEFEGRTGIQLTPEQYSEVEKMYMESDLDKDEFCKEWMKFNGSHLLNFFFTQYMVAKRQLNEMTETQTTREAEISAIQEEKDTELASFLLNKANKYADEELHEESVGLIGNSKVIAYEISNGLTLFESDKEYIMNNLK